MPPTNLGEAERPVAEKDYYNAVIHSTSDSCHASCMSMSEPCIFLEYFDTGSNILLQPLISFKKIVLCRVCSVHLHILRESRTVVSSDGPKAKPSNFPRQFASQEVDNLARQSLMLT